MCPASALHVVTRAFVWLFQGLLGSLCSELQVANPDAVHPPELKEPPRGLLLSPTVTPTGVTHGAGPVSELTLAPTLGTQLCSGVTCGSLDLGVPSTQLSPVGACLDLGVPSTHGGKPSERREQVTPEHRFPRDAPSGTHAPESR